MPRQLTPFTKTPPSALKPLVLDSRQQLKRLAQIGVKSSLPTDKTPGLLADSDRAGLANFMGLASKSLCINRDCLGPMLFAVPMTDATWVVWSHRSEFL